jgi:ABC-2 type transport system ATP-binding protein
MGEPGATLEIVGLCKRYGGATHAVDGVTVSFTPGLTGLLGPNGAGKSTLMRCIAGVENWDEGSIAVAAVGYMPETVAFPSELRVRSYLRLACSAKGVGRGWRSEIDRKLEATGLEEMGEKIIGTLSKGYRQRLGLAQAMIGDPPVLILDEPVSSLDPISIVEVRRAIRAYARSACVVVSTHQLAEATALCDRVVLLDRGRIVFDGPMAEMGRDMPGTRPLGGPDGLEEGFAHAVAAASRGTRP